MQRFAHQATSFIAVAHWADGSVSSAAFDAKAPIGEVFRQFFPQSYDELAELLAAPALPIRIELVPDAQTVPPAKSRAEIQQAALAGMGPEAT